MATSPMAQLDNRPSRLVTVWVPLAIAGFAFLCRLLPLVRGGGLFGRDTYDPSVYYAAAVALSEGSFPYRDFLLLHPPGILLFLQPFALIGGRLGDPIGMAGARVGFMALGACSAFLIYQLLRGWSSFPAAWIGATLYAVWFPAFYVERMPRLEGLATWLVLAGLLVLQRRITRRPGRAAFVVGAMVGLSVVVKVWGAALVIVLVGWLWYRHGVKRAAQAAIGALASTAAVLTPFALASPLWWDMIVLDLLGRTRSPVTLLGRAADILGLGPLPPHVALVPVIVAGALTVVAAVLTVRTVPGRLFVALAAAAVAVLFATSTWYGHYPALAAAPLCLVYGTAAGQVIETVTVAGRRVVSLVMAVVLAGCGVLLMLQRVGSVFPGPQLTQILASRPGCVTSDHPVAFIFGDALRRNLELGCPVVVDLTGYNHHLARREGLTDYRRNNPAFQQFALEYLGSGTSAVLIRLDEGDLSGDTLRSISSWPTVGRAGRVRVLDPSG